MRLDVVRPGVVLLVAAAACSASPGAPAGSGAAVPPAAPAAAPSTAPQPSATASAAPGATEAAAEPTAKQLFDEGMAKAAAGDCAAAVELLQRSRELAPRGNNTINTAVCLHKLGRLDEALDFYELALTQYPGEIDPENRRIIVDEIATLLQRVATLVLRSPVENLDVEVDGKLRPRDVRIDSDKLYVLPGERRLRFLHDEFRPLERTVRAQAGTRTRLEVALKPRGARVQVTAGDADGPYDVLMDGGSMGTTSDAKVVTPGRHVFQVIGATRGSVPKAVQAIEGETVQLWLETRTLGPAVTIEVEPGTAEVVLDDLVLGKGRWSGRLPAGSYELRVRAPGHHPRSRRIRLDARQKTVTIREKLAEDPSDPLRPWYTRLFSARGPVIGVFGGPVLGGSLESGAEIGCSAKAPCLHREPVTGATAGLRVAADSYLTPLSFELRAGFLSASTRVTRQKSESTFANINEQPFDTVYTIHDSIDLRQFFLLVGLGPRLTFTDRLHGFVRLLGGPSVAMSRDTLSVNAETTSPVLPAPVMTPIVVRGQPEGAPALWQIAPAGLLSLEVSLAARVWLLELSLSVGATLLLTQGPSLPNGELVPRDAGACSPDTPAPCLKGSSLVQNEQAYGVAPLFTPQLFVSYPFSSGGEP